VVLSLCSGNVRDAMEEQGNKDISNQVIESLGQEGKEKG